MAKHKISVTINGAVREAEVESRLLLVHLIREVFRMTGTHVGCDTSHCGFCTPGMLMTTSALLERNKNPSEQHIREAISGNLCRCTGYVNIVKAVQYAAEKMR